MISAGKKTNHKKGIAKRIKDQKRVDAEARNAAYQALSVDKKRDRNSSKVLAKLVGAE